MPAIWMNHFPLVRDPVFAQWYGTELPAAWQPRYQAGAVVYGHLHIPRTTWHDGVRLEEVSLGYPGEWQRRPSLPYAPRQVLP